MLFDDLDGQEEVGESGREVKREGIYVKTMKEGHSRKALRGNEMLEAWQVCFDPRKDMGKESQRKLGIRVISLDF